MFIESIPYFNNALTATKTSVTTAPGRIHGVEIASINTTDIFVQFFDALAADVTVGTTTPDYVLFIAASDGTNRTGKDAYFSFPWKFNKSIVIAATTTATGNTAPGTAIMANLLYS